MGLTLAGIGFLCLALCGLVYYAYLLPPTEPRVPTIPLWVALLPLISNVDQRTLFARYLEEPLRAHGAVKIFFASRWNVLVHRPAYLAEIFKDEDTFRKSGNVEKIPRSVLAFFLGNNVISSHGNVWKSYRRVIEPGLRGDLKLGVLLATARRLCSILLATQADAPHDGVPMHDVIQRYTIANFARVFYGVDFGTLESDDAYIHQLQKRLKREIHRPAFLNFPFLDRWGFPSRERARRLVTHFKDQLVQALEKSSVSESGNLSSCLLGARRSGDLTERQFRDNVNILFTAGQENPQLAILSALYLLAKNPDVQQRLHEEAARHKAGDVTEETLQGMPLLAAVVFESLRLLPPISQLINRLTTEPLALGPLMIPPQTYVGYNCYSTNRDVESWGDDADQFRPERWGRTVQEIQREYRRRRSRAEFITFHGGRRACLGERFAMLQVKVTLMTLARELRWSLDPTWPERMTETSLLYPRDLRLVFEKRGEAAS